MRESALPSALLARINTVADERLLWRRVEACRWPNGPTCDGTDHTPLVVRLMRPRAYPAHYRCECCGLLFSALQNTPLTYADLSLKSWTALAMVLLHYRRLVSGTLFAEVVPASAAYLRHAQGNLLRTARIWPRLVDVLTDQAGAGLRLAQVNLPATLPRARSGIRVYARRKHATPA